MNRVFALFIGLAVVPVWANTPPVDTPVPELRLNTAEPTKPVQDPLSDQAVTAQPAAEQKIVEVDEASLLADTELLERVMYSAIIGQNVQGIRAVLPIYAKWPEHDKTLLAYARAIVARADGRAAEAVANYREVMAAQPEAVAIRMQLAQSLYENNENEAATDQFNKLQSEDLPDNVREIVTRYQDALRQRDSWSFYAGVNVAREQNINQAPKNSRLGAYLPADACHEAQAIDPDDNCYRGWTFNDPIDATAINYQFGSSKKWSWQRGYYGKLEADAYGKIYPSESKYNDTIMRVAPGVGYADQRDEVGVSPFHERRLYGNRAYTYTNGVRLHWNHWWQPNLQSLTAFEYGDLNNTRRERADSTSQLASGSILYYTSARQYWIGGLDLYRERNPDDASESFNRYNGRIAWGQEWPQGLSTRLQFNYARRYYNGPTRFSNGTDRRDKEWGTSVSVWHRNIYFGGMTPRLTFSRNSTSSNDVYYEYNRNRVFIELNKTF